MAELTTWRVGTALEYKGFAELLVIFIRKLYFFLNWGRTSPSLPLALLTKPNVKNRNFEMPKMLNFISTLQEVFHVYLNKFEIAVSHSFLIIFRNNTFTLFNQILRNAQSPRKIAVCNEMFKIVLERFLLKGVSFSLGTNCKLYMHDLSVFC